MGSIFSLFTSGRPIRGCDHDIVAKFHACMTAKGTMNVYPGRSSYITIAKFPKVDIHLPKHQKVFGVADAPVEIAHIENECFVYSAGAHSNNSDSSVNDVH